MHWLRRLLRRAASPFGLGVTIGVALIAAGFVAVALGWRGTARTLLVPLQVPYLISGALAAVALIGAGAVLLNTQWERLSDAEEGRALAAMIDEASLLLEAARAGRDAPRGNS
jgi:hypothetical protein